ncbi:PleD family two-component system response regulator [Plastoroseomonas arctica]|uniref:diguanylate cyclase n=1 Tax=Plastoroseomonas arctica TaxID=1509237 RepID=A0AAF1JUB0_9PROT|nr:PleD family two-component system response regulator [Plastoroseomonas arctica]MBR0653830.1 PleD family two-component system response regulator [Plastoroseomonas arctica]
MTARILVVDDVAANRRLLEARLRAEFFEVSQAGSGAEAIAAAHAWSPDIILLDVMMPVMDGFECCRLLKADAETQHIPVVIVTALVDTDERVRGLEAGADDFLSKPVSEATLLSRLRALLRVKQVTDAWRLRQNTARELGLEARPPLPLALEGTRALLLRADAAEAALLGGILAADGISLLNGCDEAEARLLLAGGGFDLVLLSLRAPEVEALRFASSLRASAATRDLPLLLVGDPDQQAPILRGFDLGANDHVLRPVDPNELRARVRNQIRRRRFQESLQNDLDRSLEMAVTDPLTGLRNRRYVRRHLDALLRGGKGATALLVDVDHFKRINDGFGHASGDHVLQEIALRMQDQLRASDVIGRYGGEEFLVVLDTDADEEVMAIAGRLQRAVADMPFRLGDQRISVTISTGVAIALPGMASDVVISAADTALYRAKRAGRDRVEVAQDTDRMGPTSSAAAAF